MTMLWRHPRWRFFVIAAAICLLVVVSLALRIASPSDIVSRDQSRTVSYTIDIVANHNFILAADADGFPATKPPLVNYLSAVFVMLFGPGEWAFMLPSLLAFFGILWLIYLIARDTFAQLPAEPSLGGLTTTEWAVLLAVAFRGLSPMSLRLAFVARPDMILVFFLTLGFYAANRALAQPRPAGASWAFLFWASASLAALAKGPIALIPVAYGFLAAKIFHDDWRLASRLRPAIGAPLALVVALAWPVAVYVLDQNHFRLVLLGEELGGQFKDAWYAGFLSVWEVPFFLLSRFMPWSLLLIVAAIYFPWRRWRQHPLGPSLLYVALLTIPFVLVASRRGDRFAPFYPLLTAVCAWAAVYAMRGQTLLRASLAMLPLSAVGLAVYFFFLSDQAKDLSGQRLLDFVHEAKAAIRGQPVLVCKTENRGLALQAFLGVNQRGSYPTQAPPSGAWVVAYKPAETSRVVARSEVLPLVSGQRLFLFRVEGGSLICR